MSTLLEEIQGYFKSRLLNLNDGFGDYLENVIRGVIPQPENTQLFQQPNGYSVDSYDTLVDALAKASGIKKEDLSILRLDLALSAFWSYLSEKGHKPQNIYTSRVEALADVIIKSQEYLDTPKAKLMFSELSQALEFLLKVLSQEDKEDGTVLHKASETEE